LTFIKLPPGISFFGGLTALINPTLTKKASFVFQAYETGSGLILFVMPSAAEHHRITSRGLIIRKYFSWGQPKRAMRVILD
jgi:hypothetical protein